MNNQVPLVSVSVQTYNHCNFIQRCLESILQQETTFNYEIILGEDESSDGTREICIDYANRFPDKIRLFLRSRSDVIKVHGITTGRYNFLQNLKACKGKYVALLDGDDFWIDPKKLQQQVGFLESNIDYSICWTAYKIIRNDKIEMPIWYSDLNNIDFMEVDFKNFSSPYCTMTLTTVFRRNILLASNIKLDDFKFFKDNTLFSICLSQGRGIFLNFDSSRYRLHSDGIYSLQSNYVKAIFNYANYEELLILLPKSRVQNIITKRNNWKKQFLKELYKRDIPKFKKWLIRLRYVIYFKYLKFKTQFI